MVYLLIHTKTMGLHRELIICGFFIPAIMVKNEMFYVLLFIMGNM